MLREVEAAWNGEGELSHRTGSLMVAASGVALSFTAILFRAIDDATDWEFLTIRAGGATAAMACIAFARRGHRPVDLRRVDGRIGLAAVLLALMNVLYITALARTTTANVTFLIAAGPFAAAALARLFLGERLSRTTVIAMAIAAAGIAVMAADGVDAGDRDGFLLAALLPLLLGAYNTVLRGADDIDPVVPAFWSSALAMVTAGAVAIGAGGLAVSLRDLTIGLVAGFVLMGIGLPLFNLAHRAVPAAQIPLLLMTELVLAPLWVWIWPGEQPAGATLVGGVIVVTAVVTQVLGSDRADVPTTATVA